MKTSEKDALEKRSVSANPQLFECADRKMRDRMISNFSEYVRDLIRRDLNGELTPIPADRKAQDKVEVPA